MVALSRRRVADPALRRAALGTALVFAMSGILLASWVSRLPATRDRLGAGEAELGLALLAPGFGSLVVMPFTGWLCRRFGSRPVVAATALAAAAALVALALVPSLAALGLTLFVWGSLYGGWDVAMNVHGSAVEQRAGRDWMQRYHACWSVGGILGAGLGALGAHLRAPLVLHFAAAALLTAVLVLIALSTFVDEREAVAGRHGRAGRGGRGQDPRRPRSVARVLTPGLKLVGLVTLCATTVEGAAGDWLALFLTDARGATASLAAGGYGAIALAMAAGRFSGTTVIELLGRDGAVRAGGMVSVAGIAVTVLGPNLPVAYLGALLWALGVSVVFPAAMSAGGEAPDRPADAIAVVATIGYGGFLLGPPLIGVLAERVGLGRALLVLLVLAGAIAALAPAVRSRAG